jgi:hypothetical protein
MSTTTTATETYTTSYTDGRQGATYATLAEATYDLSSAFGNQIELAENWENYGPEDEDGSQPERLLVWRDGNACEAGPCGETAVAQIIRRK